MLSLWMGGLVQPNKTLMARAIRHCRHLVNVRLAQNDRLYLVNNMDGFVDHEHVKKSIFFDVLFGRFKLRARHHTPASIEVVIVSMNEALVALE